MARFRRFVKGGPRAALTIGLPRLQIGRCAMCESVVADERAILTRAGLRQVASPPMTVVATRRGQEAL